MTDNTHSTDHRPETVTRAGAPLGWLAYSPLRQQWRSLTVSGAIAYHADAHDAKIHLCYSQPLNIDRRRAS